jgi:long-chain acyl-CoA synthetase
LPLDLEQGVFEKTGVKIHNFYGSTECGGIAYDRTRVPRTDAAVAGSALDNVELCVSEEGTLVVGGEAVGETYWPLSARELSERRFRTADLAEIIKGEVHLRGRTSDLINVAGRKVAPEEIEAVLRKHSAVAECVVFAVAGEGSGRFESIVAAVNASQPVTVAQLNAFLSASIPAWKIPRQWWFTTELTANNRGKISRREWREKYLRQEQ